jgi:hypothetical protein
MRVARTQAEQRSERIRSRRTGGDRNSRGFSEALRSVADTLAETAVPIRGVGSLAALFTVQEVAAAGDSPARRQTIRRAEVLLDELEELQRDLLAGAISVDRLTGLSNMLRKRGEAIEDPHLKDIVGEIELRVAVELAKWEKRR